MPKKFGLIWTEHHTEHNLLFMGKNSWIYYTHFSSAAQGFDRHGSIDAQLPWRN